MGFGMLRHPPIEKIPSKFGLFDLAFANLPKRRLWGGSLTSPCQEYYLSSFLALLHSHPATHFAPIPPATAVELAEKLDITGDSQNGAAIRPRSACQWEHKTKLLNAEQRSNLHGLAIDLRRRRRLPTSPIPYKCVPGSLR